MGNTQYGENARQAEALKKRRRLRKQRIRRKKIKKEIMLLVPIIFIILMIVIVFKIKSCSQETSSEINDTQGVDSNLFAAHPDWEEDFLTQNRYSRPGYELSEVNNIFVHYVANAGSTAKQNRDYFENLSITGERSASAHFIIGLDGEIIQCVPLNEIAYAVKTRNNDSISIECCHPDEDGQFTQETYDSLLELLRWLLDVYDLDSEDVLRHYDSNGKMCPLYYVEHEDAWEQLKSEI